ncbi:hypothetical protein RHGRI_032190 [Rhododendron griersonianum]|uniref:FCP1 homology domain-containing protein n=1 Tax=Rhododendron griersonianum TaxID=479676 RepID=A0AAV6IAY7_9ERIC|nr:hypothetical protein RHGRI_032190 [Rhododendron griersonianum]
MALSQFRGPFKVVGSVFTKDEYAKVGMQLHSLVCKATEADEKLKVLKESIASEEAKKAKEKLEIWKEETARKAARSVAVSNASSFGYLANLCLLRCQNFILKFGSPYRLDQESSWFKACLGRFLLYALVFDFLGVLMVDSTVESMPYGKKLLVLDIDYTLFDHRSTAENPLELMWPYSFARSTEGFQAPRTPSCMFDDLRRNFVMNPQNGLSMKPLRRPCKSGQ